MSVPAYRRKENPLEVLNIAMEVFKDATDIAKRLQNESKKTARYACDPLLDNIRTMMYSIAIANNIFIKSNVAKNRRITLQSQAKDAVVMIQVDIQTAMMFSSDASLLAACSKLLVKTD